VAAAARQDHLRAPRGHPLQRLLRPRPRRGRPGRRARPADPAAGSRAGFGIYFFDPEGNRNEVYLRIDRDVPQPFRKSIDFGLPPEEIYAEAERLLGDGGPAYRPVQ
jgi:hypothetical protein